LWLNFTLGDKKEGGGKGEGEVQVGLVQRIDLFWKKNPPKSPYLKEGKKREKRVHTYSHI
jgi:hypothetical protein